MQTNEYSKEEYHLLKASGKVFTQLRIEAGFTTINDFAKHIGMARSLYARYETGQNMETISIHRLLTHHNLNLHQFYGRVYKTISEKNKITQN